MLRKLILAAALGGAATAAAAQPPRQDAYDRPPPAPPAAGEIAAAGDTLHRVLDAFMDLRIGPLVDAIDPAARGYPDRPETVGDLATRNDPWARQRLHAEVGRTTAGMAAVSREVGAMAPVVAAELAAARRRIEAALDAAPYGPPPR